MAKTQRRLAATALLALLFWPMPGDAAENAGRFEAKAEHPFALKTMATFDYPWALAFVDRERMLVTEKPGAVWLVRRDGGKIPVSGAPAVRYEGQNGMLDVALAPDHSKSGMLYLTFSEPRGQSSVLALARARLVDTNGKPRLEGLTVIWRAPPGSDRGQPGGIIAFSPDGRSLFLTVGDRMAPNRAQDLSTAQGSIVRLNLDGTPAEGNPFSGTAGARPEIWSFGHRNPYGLAFDAQSVLWEHEMGPRGGDELNRIEPGKNYGWPLVSNGDNYNGSAIPRHSTRPDLAGPEVYWTPVIAPAGLVFYNADRFAGWKGSALIGGLAGMSLSRIAWDQRGVAHEAERWDMEGRIRDVAVDADGFVWVIEDDAEGRLRRLAPSEK